MQGLLDDAVPDGEHGQALGPAGGLGHLDPAGSLGLVKAPGQLPTQPHQPTVRVGGKGLHGNPVGAGTPGPEPHPLPGRLKGCRVQEFLPGGTPLRGQVRRRRSRRDHNLAGRKLPNCRPDTIIAAE
jgi:hypothetical protein